MNNDNAPPLSTLKRAMDVYDRILWRVEQVTMIVACGSLFAIMVLIFLDAVLRYTLNAPLTITVDLVTLYLISGGMLSVLSYTFRLGGHVSVELFADMLPRRVYHSLVGLALLAGTIVIGIMAWEVSFLSWESWENNERMIGIYAWPIWISKAVVAASLAILELRLVHAGLTNFVAGLSGNLSLAMPLTHIADHVETEGV